MGDYELWVNINYGLTLGWIHHKRDEEEEQHQEQEKLNFILDSAILLEFSKQYLVHDKKICGGSLNMPLPNFEQL